MLDSFSFICRIETSKANTKYEENKMYILMTQEYANIAPEYREIESVKFAHKMGENGGFYKVQLIDENGIIIMEWD